MRIWFRTSPLLFLAMALMSHPATALESPFAINSDDPAAASTIAYRWIPDAGFGAVRLMANWRNMQPTAGTANIQWTDLDARVGEAEKQGLEILLSFYFIPTWVNGTDPECGLFVEDCSEPPLSTQVTAFPTFVAEVVNRYKGRIHYYGIWNEPDYSAFWSGTPQEYIDLILRPGIKAVRDNDPTAFTVGPDIYSDSNLLQSVLNSVCNDPNFPTSNITLDVIAVHSYPGAPTTTTTAAEDMLAEMDNDYLPRMASSGCSNRPLWVTEFGVNAYSSNPTQQAAFEVTQGQEYVQALAGTLARSAGTSSPRLTRLFLFRLQDNSPPQPYRSGLLRSDVEGYEKKPAFFAVENFLRSVYETRIIGVDENLTDFFELAGSGSISYIPANSITRLKWYQSEPTCPAVPCAGNDNKWNAENDTINGTLLGFNSLTSHINEENSPGIIVSVNGLPVGAPYRAEVRYGVMLGSPSPGLVAGIGASATLLNFSNATTNHSILRDFGLWKEWSALITGQEGRVNGSGTFSLKFDDTPTFVNSVFSGFRLFSPFRLDEPVVFSNGFESGNCSGWSEASPACL